MQYDFHVVAIGASAGGLKALKTFASNVIADLPVAYIVILHSQREAQSYLPEILSRLTKLEVKEIEHGTTLEYNKIYVQPPSSKVSIANKRFLLTKRTPEEKINKTIDFLFKSVAHEASDKVIGIVMSGTGTDGTEGFHAIEDGGGITITQDPQTADFDGMPLSSIKYDHPTFILPPNDMPFVIAQIITN